MAKSTKFLLLDRGQEFIICPHVCLDLSANLLIGNMVLVQIVQWSSVASHLKGQRPFSSSCSKVYDSQVYRNMEMTRECISFTFEPRDMLLSLQIGFSFVRAAVACAIFERISGWSHHL